MLDTSGSGYTAVRECWDARPVYVHRLVAYAHGVIDSMTDPRHVHHVDSGRHWVNSPENLKAVDPDEHGSHHLNGTRLRA